ncbi:DUF4229 domain-containing protein [Goodfellowiella coeruleoviolacea]|uniref:DUF4229 domain-containing protein n=1 Tax=Goodfellowiella coeruleoviolacea TaxID=334858 RepID=A0AAE3GD82_9PSEU|nr:DUF4229 domain-containing protein [Goodfellowiella coeruleoviolacea]MCP2165955.1 Protein of unknown function (DUF4229) [Goodfellowiella coeruleoviolacea]
MPTATRAGRLGLDITVYALARFGLIAALAAVLALFQVPLVVGLAVAIVVMAPLSLVLLRGLRTRVATGLAERAVVRQALRAQLRGE